MAAKTFTAPQAPDWWVGISTGKAQQDISNAVLPYLSPEDQATLKQQLAKGNEKLFGGYGTASVRAAPVTPGLRNSLLGTQRSQMAASALQNVANLYGGPGKMGKGFSFLTKAIDLLNRFGGSTGAMSREAFQSFTAEANALLEGTKGSSTLAPFASLASMILGPNLSAGEVAPARRVQQSTIYGAPSSQLY